MTGVGQSDAVAIQWRVNDISSSSPSWQSYITNNGITAVGTGTHNTTLTIPGENTTLNRTTVTSLASGLLSNGSSYVNTDNDTLYIQGMIVSTCTLNISQGHLNNVLYYYHCLPFASKLNDCALELPCITYT